VYNTKDKTFAKRSVNNELPRMPVKIQERMELRMWLLASTYEFQGKNNPVNMYKSEVMISSSRTEVKMARIAI
jgi:hypothetical protein